MAKRFTDTEIWNKLWFRKLSPRLKETWRYLCDKCDHAGIWEIDIEALVFNVGEVVTFEELKEILGDRINHFRKEKIFIPGFITFQYKCSIEDLNPENRVHKSVIDRLKSMGLFMPLASPLQGSKDKDKEKDRDKEKDKEVEGHVVSPEDQNEEIKKQTTRIIELSNSLFTRNGFQIDLNDFHARQMIGLRLSEDGYKKIEYSVNQAKKDYYDDQKMYKMCQWRMLFRPTSIEKLYADSQLSPPEKKNNPVRGQNEMPEEFK